VRRKLFGAAYLASSAGALILEIAWTRLLVPVVGGSAASVALVLAGFLLGLGLGAAVASRHSRCPAAIRFAIWQLAGAAAGFVPLALCGIEQGPRTLVLAAVAGCAIPLGTAFPLAARYRAADDSTNGPGFGVLYALDTAGGLLGVLIGTLGIYGVGIPGCLALAAAAKVACAVIALAAAPSSGPTAMEYEPDPTAGTRIPFYAWGLAGMAGFCLLGAENLWSRLLSFVLFHGSSSLAFAGMLCCVLGGTAAGAAVSRKVPPRRSVAGTLAVAAGISIALSLAVIGAWKDSAIRSPGCEMALVVLLAVSPASFFSGMLFAVLCAAFSHVPANRPAGWLLFSNLAGAVVGSLAIGLFAVPILGLSGTMTVLALALSLAGLCVLGRAAHRKATLVAALLVATAVALSLTAPRRWAEHLGQPIFYREGPAATVAVVENPPGVRRLFIDGVAVAGTDLAMQADQKALAHLPLLLHRAPERALTIGFGSGQTSASMLLHPGLRVDAVEILPEVAEAAAFFSDINGGLPQNAPPRFRLHLADARTWLKNAGGEAFDVIVNDCTDLAYKSDASLYTEEFFRLVRARLRPGGIGAAWLPLRADRPFTVTRSVMAAFLSVFPDGELWVFDSFPLHFGILVGRKGPIEVDVERFERVLANPAIAADLEPVGLADPYRLAASRYAGARRLANFVRKTAVHRDKRPVAEWFASFERGGDESACDLLEDLGLDGPTSFRPGSAAALGSIAKRISQRPFLFHGHCEYARQKNESARAFYLRALRLDIDDEVPRTLVGVGPRDRLETTGESGVPGTRDGGQCGADFRLGAIRLLEGKPAEAIEIFEKTSNDRACDASPRLGLAISFIYSDLFDFRSSGTPGLSPVIFQLLQGVEGKDGTQSEIGKKAIVARWLVLLPAWLRWCVLSLTFAGL